MTLSMKIGSMSGFASSFALLWLRGDGSFPSSAKVLIPQYVHPAAFYMSIGASPGSRIDEMRTVGFVERRLCNSSFVRLTESDCRPVHHFISHTWEEMMNLAKASILISSTSSSSVGIPTRNIHLTAVAQ